VQVASLGGSHSAADVDAAKAAGLADITVRFLLCDNSFGGHAAGSGLADVIKALSPPAAST
jgi:hypothetical protein